MKKKHTRQDILDTAHEGFVAMSQYAGWPRLHPNYVAGISEVGVRKTPVLVVTLTTGQTFEIRCREVKG